MPESLETNPHPVVRITNRGQVSYANRAARSLLIAAGWQPGELAPDTLRTLCLDASHAAGPREYDWKSPDGRVVAFNCVPQLSEDAVTLFGADVTEVRQLSAAHDECQQRLAGIVESATDAMISVDEQRCLAAGMDAHLSKPISAETYTELVERLAGDGRSRTTSSQDPNEPSAPREPAEPDRESGQSGEPSVCDQQSIFCLEQGVRCCGDRYLWFQNMVDCFFREYGSIVSRLQAAAGSRQPEQLRDIAHAFKGTVLYLAAPSALQAVRQVEELAIAGDLHEAPAAIAQLEKQLVPLAYALRPHRLSRD